MKNLAASAIFCLLTVVIGVSAVSCNRGRQSGMKGQTNATLTFYGKVVDQDGAPMGGARFEFRVEAYPKDWTFDTRDRDNDASTVTAGSGADGRFQFHVTAC